MKDYLCYDKPNTKLWENLLLVAYSYLEADNLADALHDSEEYMKGFYHAIPELQRITRGKPGKVPKGKPRVTDGTLAAIRRETPKQIIQQLPTGVVIIKDNPDMQDKANAILQDVILANANSGGTPYSKAKRGIKNTIDIGSCWAECFFNRRGSIFHADYRIKNYRDILFEQGKVSEFDSNFMPVIDWMTEGDLKALIWQQKELKKKSDERKDKYESDWDLKALQELLDNGPNEKDEDSKSESEKKATSSGSFFKIVKFYQIGVGATFFKYAPAIKKTIGKCVNKDPRGIIPVHGLVPEDDDESPLGEPLAAISAGKQNLLDFDMQMYQYGQGLQYSPPVKKWGATPTHKIKLVPDAVIEMQGNRQTDDFEVVAINNAAINNFAQNYGLIKSQILNETGRTGDSSISATSGNPGFSKTQAGVKQQQARIGVSDNDLTKCNELWIGRIFETLLNIQFAESQGVKDVDLEPSTMKRYQLQDSQVDYDQEMGPIKFTVDASSSKSKDDSTESDKLDRLMEIKAKYLQAGAMLDDKFMLMYNQIVKNAGVDDAENLLYTDEEIAQAKQMHEMQQQQQLQAMQQASQPQQEQGPPPPRPLGESIGWTPGDLTPSERAQALAQVGIQADQENPPPNAIAQATDTAIKTDKHVHDTVMGINKHSHDQAQSTFSNRMTEQQANQPQMAGSNKWTITKPTQLNHQQNG